MTRPLERKEHEAGYVGPLQPSRSTAQGPRDNRVLLGTYVPRGMSVRFSAGSGLEQLFLAML